MRDTQHKHSTNTASLKFESAPRCTEVRCYRVVHAMHVLVLKLCELMLSASIRTALIARC